MMYIHMASDVVSIRVSRGLKREMEELGIDYPTLVREYLEEVVRREKRRRILEEADRVREGMRNKYGDIDLSTLVREDRDGPGR